MTRIYGVARRCVAGAINNYTTQLLDYGKQTSQYNLTEALLFLSHFMGDIHQDSLRIEVGTRLMFTVAFKSREDHRKQMELEEARKTPAEVDEDGKEINPHIPQYMSMQRDLCGAMRHTTKTCMEKPPSYAHVIERYEARDEARKKFLKDQQLKKLEEKGNTQNVEEAVSDDEDNEDALKVDEAKVDESKQMDFAKWKNVSGLQVVVARVLNLRIREDTAKYLLNLDVNSAHYDPKTRSMREDPLPDMDPNEKFYVGDNQNRVSGQALEFKQLNIHAWEAFEKGLMQNCFVYEFDDFALGDDLGFWHTKQQPKTEN
ncbi:unnamed protein product [Lactuca virosa]|uniref:Pre-mRNA-splicing factor SLU7 n=1 Tax=Lactuca virosa TaxID=75947 RepID=A0AAU9NSC9_9ASTR|nr:unnamed protein product [Lactuca virosa]